jgi:hypothetical protein
MSLNSVYWKSRALGPTALALALRNLEKDNRIKDTSSLDRAESEDRYSEFAVHD